MPAEYFVDRPLMLVAEDDNEIRLFRVACEEMGIHTQLVVHRNGADASAYLANRSNPRPSALVMNLKAPASQLCDMMAWIGGHEPNGDYPVIAWNACCLRRDFSSACRQCAATYRDKPVSFARLLLFLQDLQENGLNAALCSRKLGRRDGAT